MDKDEMKNRISLALKDPILQQGFEIICKENAELKSQIEKMKCCGNCKHQYEGQYHNGFRCKDHYKEEVCESYEWELSDEKDFF